MSRPTDTPLDSRQPQSLSASDVHVWTVEADQIGDDVLVRCHDVLDDSERERLARFSHDRTRRAFLLARSLVRDVLSRYAEISHHDWRFVDNRYGRPEVHPSLDCGGLVFNISHTDGLIACAVARGREIGIDVEHVDRRWSGVGLARRYFSPQEVDDLLALPADEHREGFFAYWTLKEAYIKARGMGLALPLDQFGFRLAADREPTIEIDPRLGDEPTTWRFYQFRPSHRHRMALAVRHSGDEPVVRLGTIVPLAR